MGGYLTRNILYYCDYYSTETFLKVLEKHLILIKNDENLKKIVLKNIVNKSSEIFNLGSIPFAVSDEYNLTSIFFFLKFS